MPERVGGSQLQSDEISLNAVRYPIVGQVRPILTSLYPPKIVQGDVTSDSNQRVSVVRWGDFRGGLGVNLTDGTEDLDRSWYSSLSQRYKGHLVLPPRTVRTAASGAIGTLDVGFINDLKDNIYAAFSRDVRRFNDSGGAGTWSSSVHTLPAVATNSIVGHLPDNVIRLFVAHTDGYSYTADGTTWVDDTENMKYLAFWNDRLWGIDNSGQLRFSQTIGDWIDDAKLLLPDGYATDLLVARAADGEFILYAATKVGLFAHDADNARFVKTELDLPFHNEGGTQSVRWQDAIYVPAGLSVYKFVNANQATITVVGPDRDHGLPSDRRGVIAGLISTHNDLIAMIDGTENDLAAGSARTFFDSNAFGSHQTGVFTSGKGISHILGRNGIGAWENKWVSASSTRRITTAHVANTRRNYRLWWGHDGRVYYQSLPREVVNPDEITTFEYEDATNQTQTHETPWFDAGQNEIEKLAVRFKIEVKDVSATSFIIASFATDYGTSFTNFTSSHGSGADANGHITAAGSFSFAFPNSTTPNGTVFRAIKFRLTYTRGTTITASPDTISLALEYRKKLDTQFGFDVTIDFSRAGRNRTTKGRSAQELRAALIAAIESSTLLEFTFRDDTGNTRNYYVDVAQFQGLEFPGHDEGGQARIQLVEV